MPGSVGLCPTFVVYFIVLSLYFYFWFTVIFNLIYFFLSRARYGRNVAKRRLCHQTLRR